jgi:hypothetical protein
MTTRRLSIGLLVAGLCGGCGGSAVKGDGGVDHPVDHVSENLLVGTLDPNGAVVCITAPLKLVDGQAQCTVVQHLAGDGGVTDTTLPSCNTAAQDPCWALITTPATCPDGGLSFMISPDPAAPSLQSLSYDYSCELN